MKPNLNPATNQLQLAVILTDKVGKIQWVNDGFTSITGYQLNEVKGKKPKLLQGKNTEAEVVQKIRSSIKNLLPIKTYITNYRKNGEEYLCCLVIYPVFNAQGKHTNYVAFEADQQHIPQNQEVKLLQLEPRYQSSCLTTKRALDLFTALNTLFENEAPYLNPNLKLQDVAEKLNTNTRYLSQVVNTYTGNSILHFINTFRIRDIKTKIGKPELAHLTTYGIAQLCGFRNKSTFYKVFKEFEGMTPKEFISQQQQNSPSPRPSASH